MANGLTLSVVCCCFMMALVVEVKALDCSNAGDMMFLCLSGNKRRTADAAPETRSEAAEAESGARRVANDDEQFLRGRILEIASSLLETRDARNRGFAEKELANQRAVEESEDKREYVYHPEDRNFRNPEMDMKRSYDAEVEEERRTVNEERSLEDGRKRLLSRWLNEGEQTYA